MNNNYPEQQLPPTPSELLKLSSEYIGRIEKYVETVTKAINDAEKIHNYFLEKEKEIKTSRFERFIRIAKVLTPFFILLIFIVGLFLLPCGIKWDGFGVKFSNSECIQKNEAQRNKNQT